MGKFILRFFSLILLIAVFLIGYLSIAGFKTDKFNNLIKDKANNAHKHVRLEFKDTKIYLNLGDFKLTVKLQDPKILIKKKDIVLSKFDFYLPLKSFYTSDFILEKANLGFENNDIKDLIKVSNIFLPRILNKKLDKVFIKGNLDGDLTLPFTQEGSISKDYTFYLKILDSNIRLNKNFELKNFTANLNYGEKSFTEGLKINI